MARNEVGLRITTNPAWGLTAATIATPESFMLARTTGWTDDYGVDQFPPMEVFQNAWFEFTSFMQDVGLHGILEWHMLQIYTHPAACFGSDGRPYLSVQNSIGVDPIADTDRSHWKPVIGTTDGTLGVATAAQIEAGDNSELIMAPQLFLQALFKASPNARWQATEGQFGLARIASAQDILNRATDRLVTADQLIANIPLITPVPHSSTTERGIIRTATRDEAIGGTNSSAAVTPAGGRAHGDARYARRPGNNRLHVLFAPNDTDNNAAQAYTTVHAALSGIEQNIPIPLVGLVELHGGVIKPVPVPSLIYTNPFYLVNPAVTREGAQYRFFGAIFDNSTEALATAGLVGEIIMTSTTIQSRLKNISHDSNYTGLYTNTAIAMELAGYY